MIVNRGIAIYYSILIFVAQCLRVSNTPDSTIKTILQQGAIIEQLENY